MQAARPEQPTKADLRDARLCVRKRRADVRRKLMLLTHLLTAAGLVPELTRTPKAVVTLNGRTYS